MKIAFVFEAAALMTNGTSYTCSRFAKELIARGHEVRIVGVEYPDPKDTPSNYYPVKAHKLGFLEPIIRREGFSFVEVEDDKIYNAIKDVDVCHLFLPFKLEKHARLIAESLGIACTTAFHLLPQNITAAFGLLWCEPLNQWTFKMWKDTFYQHIRYVHCPSEMSAQLVRDYHLDGACPVVVSNGVNVDFFHPIEAERPSYYEGKFLIACVGRLAKEKRQDVLIKAVALSKHRKDIQILFCGKGPLQEKYRRLAANEDLPNAPVFKFCNQEQLREILNYSDLYVHCADFEIEGMSCIEAFACGIVPVVGNARLSATKSFALDEHCVFDSGDPMSLAERIDYFFEHPEVRKELSPKYVAKAQEYVLPVQVNRIEEMFQKAIQERKDGTDILAKGRSEKDIKASRKIFQKLLRQGVISEMPESLR